MLKDIMAIITQDDYTAAAHLLSQNGMVDKLKVILPRIENKTILVDAALKAAE